jgi:uncharacterized protein (TIGR02265 family)
LIRTPAKPILRILPPPGEITANDVLAGDIDVATSLASYPKEQTLKGMFFGRFAKELGPDWSTIEKQLASPPRLGTYVPFANYPLVDHAALVMLVAKKRSPKLPQREAVRRLAREDILTFLESTIGRVTAAAVSTPKAALLALPEVYKLVVVGPRYVAEATAENKVRLKLVNAFGLWEYQVGQLEGIVKHYGASARTRCSLEDDGVRVYDLSW